MRVATWNLLHGLDVRTGRVDLGTVAGAIAALDVEIIAVQEMDRGLRRTGGGEQVTELAGRLGWHGVFAPALLGNPERIWGPGPGNRADPGGPAYGVGLLSRHPLRCAERIALPGGGAGERRPEDLGRALPGWDHEPRVVLRARVAVPGGPDLVVATTHLSYLLWRGLRQLRIATAWTRAAARGGPAVVMGDFNLPFPLLRRGLVGSGWTVTPTGPTFPSWRPGLQLDQVLAYSAQLRDVRVGAGGPSDHLPVSARVMIA